MQEIVKINGMQTIVTNAGNVNALPERTFLCIHPIGQEASFFDLLPSMLGPEWRIVSFDQRGHGVAADLPAESLEQMVDDASAVLDIIGRRVHVLGHSMGGAVAALLAARRHSDCRTVTVAATPARGMPVFAERACATKMGSVSAVAEETIERWFGHTQDRTAIETARQSLMKMTPQGFDAVWRALATFKGYEQLAKKLPPCLCLSFTDDLSCPPPVLDEIAAIIANEGGEVMRMTIDEAGHMGLLQKPDEVASALTKFVYQKENK